METVVKDVPARKRFEITVDGELAGFAEYRDESRTRIFTHTKVYSEFEGKGVGSLLARGALDEARSAGRSIVPLCPFIAHFVTENPEYGDLVDTKLYDALRY
ncbi:MAG TPA: GNAT family N-acetyltransferase [Acidimicrobiales bacterium]|jgi:hypothetical protein